MIEATITGNVGRTPELRVTKTGKQMANFSVASTAKSGDGEQTTWIDVAVFDEQADIVSETLQPGDRVVIRGSLQLETYTKKDGTAGTSLRLLANEVGKSLRWRKRDRSASREEELVGF